MKWRILLSLPSFSLRKQLKIIIACMALHNFIRDSAIHNHDSDHFVSRTVSRTKVGDEGVAKSSRGPSYALDMSAFRDSIVGALVSYVTYVGLRIGYFQILC